MRESCISHKPKSSLLVIREDYFRLTRCDKVLAALLSVFEYWANGEVARSWESPSRATTDSASGSDAGASPRSGEISKNPNSSEESINLGIRTISEFEQLTLWIATDKQIRTKLKGLEELGFISILKGTGNHTAYTLNISYLQQALDAVDWSISLAELRHHYPYRCTHPSGLLTEPPPVNKPHPSGLLTEPLYIEEIKNLKKECVEEAAPAQTQIVDFRACNFGANQDFSTIAPDKITISLENQNLQLGECSAPPPKFSKKMENLVTQLDRGELKNLPDSEKKQLANYLMGEQIKLYRRSGWILASSPNDISVDFLRYVAWSELKQPDDLKWARNTVLSYERDITKWGQLVDIVQSWQTVTPEEVSATAITRVASRRGGKEDLQIAIQSSIDGYKELKHNPFRRKT